MDFDRRFRVEQFGMRLPDGWLSEDVRAAITAASSDSRPELLIEAGCLVYRTLAAIHSFAPRQLSDLLDRQVTLAAALERSAAR